MVQIQETLAFTFIASDARITISAFALRPDAAILHAAGGVVGQG